MKKIALIGPLPKEKATGAALGFLSLVRGAQAEDLSFKVVDLFKAGQPINAGRFSFRRALQVLAPLWVSLIEIPTASGIYYLISTTRAGFLRDFMVIHWASICGKPIILHLKSAGYQEFYPSQPKWMQGLIRHTLGRASRIIALGESIKDQFSFVHGFDRKVVVIPNGTPEEIENLPSIPRSLPASGPVHVLYLSNLIPSKGFMHVVEAARILQEAHPGAFHFDFCGGFGFGEDTPDAPQNPEDFRACLEQMNLTAQVTFHGQVSGQEKQGMLTRAHLFVLPSQYPTEGQPISVIEALAYGLPVIGTHWKGMVEQILDGINGFRVDFARPDQIADKIKEATDSEEFYSRLSAAAHQHYLGNFTRKIHLQRMFSLFKEVFPIGNVSK